MGRAGSLLHGAGRRSEQAARGRCLLFCLRSLPLLFVEALRAPCGRRLGSAVLLFFPPLPWPCTLPLCPAVAGTSTARPGLGFAEGCPALRGASCPWCPAAPRWHSDPVASLSWGWAAALAVFVSPVTQEQELGCGRGAAGRGVRNEGGAERPAGTGRCCPAAGRGLGWGWGGSGRRQPSSVGPPLPALAWGRRVEHPWP